MLETGTMAPAFELPDADMSIVKSADFRGKKHIVVYFYPKDDTPGCTMEAMEFSDLQSEFEELDTVVIGVSRDNCMSHGNFRDKHGLTVRLLADVDANTCRDYGVWQEREKNGEKRMTTVRSTFIIGKDGTLHHALYDIKPKGHAAAVLDMVRELP